MTGTFDEGSGTFTATVTTPDGDVPIEGTIEFAGLPLMEGTFHRLNE